MSRRANTWILLGAALVLAAYLYGVHGWSPESTPQEDPASPPPDAAAPTETDQAGATTPPRESEEDPPPDPALEAERELRRRAEEAERAKREAAILEQRRRERERREQFGKHLASAIRALEEDRPEEASGWLDKAEAIDPEHPELEGWRAQVETALRGRELLRLQQVAEDKERSEDWAGAQEAYEAALSLEPAAEFAVRGKERASSRRSLADRLDRHIARPERLSDPAVQREAETLLQRAKQIPSPGPRHQAQISELESRLAEATREMPVQLQSDGRTQVAVYKVGRLGTFESRTLSLRPGRYTVVGTRDGYRDVRTTLVVEPGREPEPLRIRCEERLP